MTKQAIAERDEARAQLAQWLKPGDTVYTILDHVSASGMSRAIRVVLMKCEGGKVTDLHPNHAVGKLLGLRHWRRDGRTQDALVMGGCGMDMGFALVYELSSSLFRDGFGCTGQDCPSNAHRNGDRNRDPHTADKPHWHTDGGGYALKQRWL
jgi:hypothetical protein